MKFALLLLIKVYQLVFSPLFSFLSYFGLKTGCRYPVSCSEFAEEEVRNTKSLMKSFYKISIRLMSCGPWQNFFRSSKGI